MTFEYIPNGVCSRQYLIDIQDDIIKDITIIGGCNGNLKGIKALITGMNVRDVIAKFEGIDCRGKGTSCPDQISKALKKYLSDKGE